VSTTKRKNHYFDGHKVFYAGPKSARNILEKPGRTCNFVFTPLSSLDSREAGSQTCERIVLLLGFIV